MLGRAAQTLLLLDLEAPILLDQLDPVLELVEGLLFF